MTVEGAKIVANDGWRRLNEINEWAFHDGPSVISQWFLWHRSSAWPCFMWAVAKTPQLRCVTIMMPPQIQPHSQSTNFCCNSQADLVWWSTVVCWNHLGLPLCWQLFQLFHNNTIALGVLALKKRVSVYFRFRSLGDVATFSFLKVIDGFAGTVHGSWNGVVHKWWYLLTIQ